MKNVSNILSRATALLLTLVFVGAITATVVSPVAYAQEDDGAFIDDGMIDPDAADYGIDEDWTDVDFVDVAEVEALAVQKPVDELQPTKTVTAAGKKKAGSTKKFNNMSSCVTAISSKSLKEAKQTSKNYATLRVAYLKKFSTKVTNNNKKMNSYYKANQKKYYIKDVKYQKYTHNKQLKAEMRDSRAQIVAKNKAAQAAGDTQTVAQNACSIVYDVRVLTYLAAKISYQQSVDKLYLRNSLLVAQYQSLQKAGVDMNGVKNPADTKASIDALQAKLDGISPASINDAQSNEKTKTVALFKQTLKSDMTAVAKQIKADTSSSNKAKQLLRSKKKSSPDKSTSKTSSSSSKDKTVKKTVSADRKNQICTDAEVGTLVIDGKVNAKLTSACKFGITGGLKQTSKKSVYCDNKYSMKKATKQYEACKHGYEMGELLRNE
jgi:hypothetical protein